MDNISYNRFLDKLDRAANRRRIYESSSNKPIFKPENLKIETPEYLEYFERMFYEVLEAGEQWLKKLVKNKSTVKDMISFPEENVISFEISNSLTVPDVNMNAFEFLNRISRSYERDKNTKFVHIVNETLVREISSNLNDYLKQYIDRNGGAWRREKNKNYKHMIFGGIRIDVSHSGGTSTVVVEVS